MHRVSGIVNNSYKDNIDFIYNMDIDIKDKENIFFNTANKVYFNNRN